MNLLDFLGSGSEDDSLVRCFKENSIELKNQLFLEDGLFRTYMEVQITGISLVFTDEAYFLGLPNQPIGQGELYFSGVFFYSEGKDGYTQYQGDLPFNLTFLDDRKTILEKLGQPDWQRKADDGIRVIADRWDHLPNVPYRLHVTYDKETEKISILSVSIPDQPLPLIS